jgi:hypothetical protein
VCRPSCAIALCRTRISCGTSILLNVRETRRGNREWIIQRHRKHWEKNTERRQTKHKKTITTKHTTQKTKKHLLMPL